MFAGPKVPLFPQPLDDVVGGGRGRQAQQLCQALDRQQDSVLDVVVPQGHFGASN